MRRMLLRIELLIQLVHKVLSQLEQSVTEQEEPMLQDECMLTIKEAADFFQVHKRTIGRWRTDGLIQAKTMGGVVVYSKAELIKSMKADKTGDDK